MSRVGRRAIAGSRSLLANLAGLAVVAIAQIPGFPVRGLLPWLCRLAQPAHLREALSPDCAQLAVIAVRSEAGRAIAAGRLVSEADPADLLKEVVDEYLAHAVSRLIVQHPDREAVSRLCYNAALSPSEAGKWRLSAALIVTARCSPDLLATHARKVLSLARRMACQSVDPYEPPGVAALAQLAGAQLIAHHPELDDDALRFLEVGSSIRVERMILAGLHLRNDLDPVTVIGSLEAIKPSRDRAIAMMAQIDSRAQPVVLREPPTLGSFRRSAAWAPRLLSWMGPPSIIAMSAYFGPEYLSSVDVGSVDLSGALAIFGALFAVDVFVSEQSAKRLPGVLSRHASRAKSLSAAYAAALSLLVAVGVGWLDASPSPARDWAQAASTLVVLLATAFVLRGVISRLDPTRAAEAFVRNRRSSTTRVGRRFRRMQVQAIADGKELASAGHARTASSPVVTVSRVPVRARRRGFVELRTRRLRALGKNRRWDQGDVILEVSSLPGTMVQAGSEFVSVSAQDGTSVSRAEVRAARRCFRVARSEAVDRVAESATALVRLLGERVEDGDRQGAERTGLALIELSRGFHGAPGLGTGNEGADDVPPVSPVLLVLMQSLVGLAAKLHRRDLELVTTVIRELLNTLGKDHHGVSLLATLARGIDENEDAAVQLLRAAAERGLEVGDRRGLSLVRDGIDQLQSGSGPQLDLVADLAAQAMWMDYFAAPTYWVWARSKASLSSSCGIPMALRIGAAAMEARLFSVALQVVADVHDKSPQQLEALVALAEDEDMVAREGLISGLGGGYLGRAPARSVSRFGNFAAGLASGVLRDDGFSSS